MTKLYQLYFLIPQLKSWGFFGKAIHKINALVLKRLLDLWYPGYYLRTASKMGLGITTQKRETQFIVSLTSFPARINDIWICIESLLRQTVQPDELILWLAESQFPDKKIPETLEKLKSRGLTIRFCEDLRSHKKYYYAMKEYPTDCIITFDDDLYYDANVLKRVVDLYHQYPNCICTNRAHEIILKDGIVVPYKNWNHNVVTIVKPTNKLLATGGAGTLYPPNLLSSHVFDKELIKSLCFHADDVWLKLMATLNGTKVVTHSHYNKDFLTISSSQNEKLVSQNVFDGGNDTQFQKVCQHFTITASQFTDS
jgi:hypothetical protein